MTRPLTQKEFDYYYSKTDPTEPKPVREIHAIRIAMAEQEPARPRTSPPTLVRDFVKKYGIKTIRYAES